MPRNPLPPENVTAYTGISPTERSDQKTRIKPQPQRFESYMKEPAAIPEAAPGGITPMDLARKGNALRGMPTTKSLLEQMNSAQDGLETIRRNLKTPQLKFKRSAEHLLRSKLTDANKNLAFAAKKMGMEPRPPKKTKAGISPIEKLITFAADGQNQLVATKQMLQKLASSNPDEPFHPEALLLVQVKLTQAQQEIEYASILISKVVDAIKQTINIQI